MEDSTAPEVTDKHGPAGAAAVALNSLTILVAWPRLIFGPASRWRLRPDILARGPNTMKWERGVDVWLLDVFVTNTADAI